MDFQAVPDLVQMNALQGAALLLLHGVMLASAVALGLLSLLCLFDLWQGGTLGARNASKSKRRASSPPTGLPRRAETGTKERGASRLIGSQTAAREEPEAGLIAARL